jgi:circadian clock protein KaiB
MNGNCRIETVDVVKDFQAAIRNNILITPALIMIAPLPSVMVLGNLSDRQKVLLALRLSEGDS